MIQESLGADSLSFSSPKTISLQKVKMTANIAHNSRKLLYTLVLYNEQLIYTQMNLSKNLGLNLIADK